MEKPERSLLSGVEDYIRFYQAVRANFRHEDLTHPEYINRGRTNDTQLIVVKRELLSPLKPYLMGKEGRSLRTIDPIEGPSNESVTREFRRAVREAQKDLEHIIIPVLQGDPYFVELLHKIETSKVESRREEARESIKRFWDYNGYRLGMLTEIVGKETIEKYLDKSDSEHERKFEKAVDDILRRIESKRKKTLKTLQKLADGPQSAQLELFS